MDEDNKATKQHVPPSLPSSLDLPPRVVQQQPQRQKRQQRQQRHQMSPRHSSKPSRNTTTGVPGASSAQGQELGPLSDYAAYGYSAAHPSSLGVDSLQNVALPLQAPLSTESVGQQFSQQQQQQGNRQVFSNFPLHHFHHQQPQQSPYDSGLVYGLPQPGPVQEAYPLSLPDAFPSRSAEPLSSMTPQFGVSQYFESSGHASEVMSHSLSPHRQSGEYQQEDLPSQSTMTASYPSSTIGHNPVEEVGGMRQHQQYQYHQPQYNQQQYQQGQVQYQQSQSQQQQTTQSDRVLQGDLMNYNRDLVTALEHIRAKRLLSAYPLVLKITKWLVHNAAALGLLRDDPTLSTAHMKLWQDLNTCWLSLCQTQKDLTLAMLRSKQRRNIASLLTAETMNHMGDVIVSLSDMLEPHGLVDYQRGLWEEEIIDTLGECIDLYNRLNPAFG